MLDLFVIPIQVREAHEQEPGKENFHSTLIGAAQTINYTSVSLTDVN